MEEVVLIRDSPLELVLWGGFFVDSSRSYAVESEEESEGAEEDNTDLQNAAEMTTEHLTQFFSPINGPQHVGWVGRGFGFKTLKQVLKPTLSLFPCTFTNQGVKYL